jgi:hypothetical protein
MIAFIIGLIIGLIPTFILLHKQKSNEIDTEKYLRRGILDMTFTVTRVGFEGDVDIQYEIGEIDCSDDISKIEVISLTSTIGRFNTVEEKKMFINQINHSWVTSSRIKWINSKITDRNKKIDKILK